MIHSCRCSQKQNTLIKRSIGLTVGINVKLIGNKDIMVPDTLKSYLLAVIGTGYTWRDISIGEIVSVINCKLPHDFIVTKKELELC
jgi:hypothetical protein